MLVAPDTIYIKLCSSTGMLGWHGVANPASVPCADYMRAAMRMAALQFAGTLFVMTHDSIGLGEDGPTHQPIEHLASFRAMPNILMMRPGDGNETAGAYQVCVSAPSFGIQQASMWLSHPDGYRQCSLQSLFATSAISNGEDCSILPVLVLSTPISQMIVRRGMVFFPVPDAYISVHPIPELGNVLRGPCNLCSVGSLSPL